MSFKIIAIRPLQYCSDDFLKNLDFNVFYTLYNEYKITPSNTEEQIDFQIVPSVPPDLYSNDSVDINISAIVGKNGSGKSSIIELLYAAFYNFSIHYKFIVRTPIKPKKAFSFDEYSLEDIEANVSKYNTTKPDKNHLESVNLDISVLERIIHDIGSELKVNPVEVDFASYFPIQTTFESIRDKGNSNSQRKNLLHFLSLIEQLKLYRLNLERHFNAEDDEVEEEPHFLENINVQIIFETDSEPYVLSVKGRHQHQEF